MSTVISRKGAVARQLLAVLVVAAAGAACNSPSEPSAELLAGTWELVSIDSYGVPGWRVVHTWFTSDSTYIASGRLVFHAGNTCTRSVTTGDGESTLSCWWRGPADKATVSIEGWSDPLDISIGEDHLTLSTPCATFDLVFGCRPEKYWEVYRKRRS